MSDRELYNLACNSKWPDLIGELGKVDVGGGKNKMLFVEDGYRGWCVFMMAANRNRTLTPAPVWKALIEAALRVGLDLQSILTRVDNSKFTVLHYAAAWSSEAAVVGCLAFLCPSALDMKGYANRTPLERAKACNRPSSSVIAALTQVS